MRNEVGGDIHAGDACAGLRGGDREVAGAAGDVEQGIPRAKLQALDELRGAGREAARDGEEVAAGPDGDGAGGEGID